MCWMHRSNILSAKCEVNEINNNQKHADFTPYWYNHRTQLAKQRHEYLAFSAYKTVGGERMPEIYFWYDNGLPGICCSLNSSYEPDTELSQKHHALFVFTFLCCTCRCSNRFSPFLIACSAINCFWRALVFSSFIHICLFDWACHQDVQNSLDVETLLNTNIIPVYWFFLEEIDFQHKFSIFSTGVLIQLLVCCG